MVRSRADSALSFKPSLLDTITLQGWLEWAGVRLIAMPGPRAGPQDVKCCWPDYETDTFQVLEFRKPLTLRVAAPTREEIPIVDDILSLPNVCSQPMVRRVLHCRALIHPIKSRYLYNWSRIAKLLDVKINTVKTWHRNGLKETILKADPIKVCRIQAFYAEIEHST